MYGPAYLIKSGSPLNLCNSNRIEYKFGQYFWSFCKYEGGGLCDIKPVRPLYHLKESTCLRDIIGSLFKYVTDISVVVIALKICIHTFLA